MSTKPKIYAFCPAGCKHETVHKEQFDRSASHILLYPEYEDTYILEIGDEHKIFAPKAEGKFDCTLYASYRKDDGSFGTFDFDCNVIDKYADYFTFRLLECTPTAFVYEYGGTRYSETPVGTLTGLALIGATEVLIYNADAQIVGIDGKDGANGKDGADGKDGRSLVWRGEFDVTIDYKVDDVVEYNGSTYICIQNKDNTQDPTYEDYWELLAAKGKDGTGLPAATTADNGKIIEVVGGAYVLKDLANSSVKTYIDEYIASALGGDY